MPIIQASSGRGAAWVNLKLPEAFAAPEHVAEIHEKIQWGDVEKLGFSILYRQVNQGSNFGDLLWTTGATKIASATFIATLSHVSATGYSTFPLTVLKRGGAPALGYSGLVVTGGPSDDLHLLDPGQQWWRFGVSDSLLAALTSAGVDRFDVQ
jgi:hypothetical protein